ncbi:hypothetical protein FQA39_LY08218 [Lamprigera yunnana]|nr:hypothetical protein FQA39_LY08218 [Lamprigera yunnana]
MNAIKITFHCFFFYCIFYSHAAVVDDGENEELEGYYWRHYTDHVPIDALPGGRDIDGETTYIGQALYRNILIPGQFIVGDRKLYFEWGDAERVTDSNIKILCTKHPEQFEWIRTTTKEVKNIPNKNFILGGFESDFTVYIGRVAVGNTLAIGKVIVSNQQSQGFHTTCRQNASFVRAQEFEVLNYEPSIPTPQEIKERLSPSGSVTINNFNVFVGALKRLVLLTINRPLELIQFCRKLGQTKIKITEYRPPKTRQLLLEPDLDYRVPSLRRRVILVIDIGTKLNIIPYIGKGEWHFASENLEKPVLHNIEFKSTLTSEQRERLESIVNNYVNQSNSKTLGYTVE